LNPSDSWHIKMNGSYGESLIIFSSSPATSARPSSLRVLFLGLADVIIAAIALINELKLVTRNTEHFSRVPNLKIITY